MRVLIVGCDQPTHVGRHLREAADSIGVRAEICNTDEAYEGPFLQRKIAWWMRGHRPAQLTRFSEYVQATAARFEPDVVVTTGLAPIDGATVRRLGASHAVRVNFLTDDPWNRVHHAPWFSQALRQYDHVFSPRRANLDDLIALRGPRVHYLPFAYNPATHFIEAPPASDADRYDVDVMFAGGADRDRVRAVAPFLTSGLRIGLYGGYWDDFPDTASLARGHLDAQGLRHAAAGAKVCLCLVRRANRDGHSMRSFEVPAMGGCLLAEDTAEHRAFFGGDGEAVAYFRTPAQAVEQARRLVADAATRRRLAAASHHIVTHGAHRYADRLAATLAIVTQDHAEDSHRRSGALSRV